MSDTSVKKLCSRCRGSGTDDNYEESITCPVCSGVGYSGTDIVDTTDIMDAISDVLDKCNDIKEAVDAL